MVHPEGQPFVPEYNKLALLVDSRRPDLAERELREALRQLPENGPLHGLLAIALAKQGRDKEAMRAAREGMRLEPCHPWTSRAWAAVHATLPRFRFARGTVAAVRQAVERFPFDASLHGYLALATLNRAMVRTRAGKLDREALRAAEAGLALDPEHVDCHLVRAQALLRLGRVAEAREAARRALALAPEASAPHAVAGAVELQAGSSERGHAFLREALRLDPADRYAEEKLGVTDENQRWFMAMKLQLQAWKWPMRFFRLLGVAAAVFGFASGWIFPAVFAPFYTMALHPAAWYRLAKPESRQVLASPGALRRADVVTARGTILFCVMAVVGMFWYALSG